MDDPFDLIEEATKRANALRRTLLTCAEEESDPDIQQQCLDAAERANRLANELYDRWDQMLGRAIEDWEARANVTATEFVNANAQLKRSITSLEQAVEKVENVVRAIQRLEQVVGIVARIAAI